MPWRVDEEKAVGGRVGDGGHVSECEEREKGLAQGRLAQPEVCTEPWVARLGSWVTVAPTAGNSLFTVPTDIFYRLLWLADYTVDFIWRLFKN